MYNKTFMISITFDRFLRMYNINISLLFVANCNDGHQGGYTRLPKIEQNRKLHCDTFKK